MSSCPIRNRRHVRIDLRAKRGDPYRSDICLIPRFNINRSTMWRHDQGTETISRAGHWEEKKSGPMCVRDRACSMKLNWCQSWLTDMVATDNNATSLSLLWKSERQKQKNCTKVLVKIKSGLKHKLLPRFGTEEGTGPAAYKDRKTVPDLTQCWHALLT